MSDNEDLLADDLGDHSLADYNLGNDEEDQLLADDFDTHNVPSRAYVREPSYEEPQYTSEPQSYEPAYEQSFPPEVEQYNDGYSNGVDNECVVPNVAEVPPNEFEADSFNRYGEPIYETPAQQLPAEVPVSPITEAPPQIAPALVPPNGEVSPEALPRERFPAERPPGAVRVPQVRDIPDSLDKVYIPRQNHPRDSRSWRNPRFPASQYRFHNTNPYRRDNVRPETFQPRPFQRPVRPQPTEFERPPPNQPAIVPQGPPPFQQQPSQQPPMHQPPMQQPPMQQPPMQQPPMQQPPMQQPPIQQDRLPFQPQNVPPGFAPERFNAPGNFQQNQRFNSPERFPQSERFPGPGRFPPAERFRPPDRFRQPNFNNQPPPPGAFNEDFRPQRPYFERPQLQFRGPNPFQRPQMRPMGQFNRPMGQNFDPRMGMPGREVVPNSMNLPQITIRQAVPPMPMLPRIEIANVPPSKLDPPPPGVSEPEPYRREPEVRMRPLQLPSNVPFTGKKVLINPHFKGNIQPPMDGLTYIPTRIEKPPASPPYENKFAGPVKDIDDAAERFIAEQRSALARAANRKPVRRSPQRYIENTTVEVENDLANRDKDRELLRRQEEFINANRAGLRRRMRSPSPPRRSPSPLARRPRPATPPTPSPPNRSPPDEESEYKRKMRDQEYLRERVLRAKEVRRRKNAIALQKILDERVRTKEQERPQQRYEKEKPDQRQAETSEQLQAQRPTNVRADQRTEERAAIKEKSPEKQIPEKREPEKKLELPEKKLEPQEKKIEVPEKKIELPERERKFPEKERKFPEKKNTSPNDYERDMTPPLPAPTEKKQESKPDKEDDDADALDLILDELDGILSDDDDTGRFKEKASSTAETSKPKPPADLRSKLPPKTESKPVQRQKIVFSDDSRERRRREKSPAPVKRAIPASSDARSEDAEPLSKTARGSRARVEQAKQEPESSQARQRLKITFDKKQDEDEKKPFVPSFASRRVVLQRKITPAKPFEKSVFSRIEKEDPSQPTAGIFSRAVRTAIGTKQSESQRFVVQRQTSDDPKVEVEMDSDSESLNEDLLLRDDDEMLVATVTNLPHGMTDTRLRTLAGGDVQSLSLDKERRSAKITFKSNGAAENFKKKFNNKMVAASRLTVMLR